MRRARGTSIVALLAPAAVGAAAVATLPACGAHARPPPRPQEIPLEEFHASDPNAESQASGDATATTSSSAAAGGDGAGGASPGRGGEAAPGAAGGAGEPAAGAGASSSAAAASAGGASPGGAGGAPGGEPPGGAASGVAAKLDAKDGFAGAQLGSAVKAFRGLKLSEKNGERATYRVSAKKPVSYAGAPLKDVTYTFQKGKLAMIFFSVKQLKDCKPVKEGLERELGPAQKSTTTPAEAYVWKGDRVGMRFAIGQGFCGGTVVSKELSEPSAWGALEP